MFRLFKPLCHIEISDYGASNRLYGYGWAITPPSTSALYIYLGTWDCGTPTWDCLMLDPEGRFVISGRKWFKEEIDHDVG